jgi:hypothetical protein
MDEETGRVTCVQPAMACATEVAAALCGVEEGNGCVDTQIGAFECQCKKSWTKTEAGGCEPPPNLCLDDDHGGLCFARAEGSQTANSCVNTHDGQYYCVCLEPGWEDGPNGPRGPLTCTEPRMKCAELSQGGYDPCFALSAQFNVCNDRTDGTYYCTCDAVGYSSVLGAMKCQPPSDPCLGDPCHVSLDEANQCIDMLDGTHFCICDGRDWVNQYVPLLFRTASHSAGANTHTAY